MGQVTIFCTTYYSTTKTHGTRIEVVKSVTSLTPPAAYIYMFSPRFQAARSWALALSRAEWLPEEFQTDQIAQCHRSHGHAELGGRLYCCWRALVQVSCGSKALRWTRKELQLQKTKHQLVDILLTSTKSSSFQDFSLDKTKKIICPLVRIQEYTAQSPNHHRKTPSKSSFLHSADSWLSESTTLIATNHTSAQLTLQKRPPKSIQYQLTG